MARCMRCMEEIGEESFCTKCGMNTDYHQPDMGQLPEETILKKRYLIGHSIYQDAIGFTYVAWDILLEKRVIIKEWYPAQAAGRMPDHTRICYYMDKERGEYLKKTFIEEARKMQMQKNFPMTVPILDVFLEHGTAYYVREYLEKQTKDQTPENIEQRIMQELRKELQEQEEKEISFFQLLSIPLCMAAIIMGALLLF